MVLHFLMCFLVWFPGCIHYFIWQLRVSSIQILVLILQYLQGTGYYIYACPLPKITFYQFSTVLRNITVQLQKKKLCEQTFWAGEPQHSPGLENFISLLIYCYEMAIWKETKRLMMTEGEEERARIILLPYETLVPPHFAYKRDRSINLKKNTTEVEKVKRRADPMIKRVE